MRSAIDCSLSASLWLKIMYQAFHTNATGQEPRPFHFHQCGNAFTSVIDPHNPLKVNDKITLGMSVTGFLPVGPNASHPGVSQQSLENKPLLGVGVDSRNLQHRSPCSRSSSHIATRMTRSPILVSPGMF